MRIFKYKLSKKPGITLIHAPIVKILCVQLGDDGEPYLYVILEGDVCTNGIGVAIHMYETFDSLPMNLQPGSYLGSVSFGAHVCHYFHEYKCLRGAQGNEY